MAQEAAQKGPVSTGREELAALRHRCKNTMHVAAAILGKDGVQNMARAIYLVMAPYYSAHAKHAREVREPNSALAFYASAAAVGYLEPVMASAGCLRSLENLEQMGFDCSF